MICVSMDVYNRRTLIIKNFFQTIRNSEAHFINPLQPGVAYLYFLKTPENV